MTLSRSLTAVVAALFMAGCTPDQQSVLITNFFAPDPKTCLNGAKPVIAQTRGSLNAGLSRTFLTILTVDSLFADNALVPRGNVASLNEIDYTYTTSPGPTGTPVGLPSTESRSIAFELQPGTKDNLLLENLIGPQAAISLDAVPAGPVSDYFVMHVEVSLKGTLVSGGAVQSNRLNFPISVYNTGSECGTLIVSPSAPCGNIGQDVVCCVENPMVPGTCAP